MNPQDSQIVAEYMMNSVREIVVRINNTIDYIESEYTRPHTLLHPSISLDGNKWSCLYGSNIMEGVCGWGDSPAEAALDFDRMWHKKEEKNDR